MPAPKQTSPTTHIMTGDDALKQITPSTETTLHPLSRIRIRPPKDGQFTYSCI